MNIPILAEFTFWDVIWWMIIAFFFMMAISVFISVIADIFRRNDIGGFSKAIWLIVLFFLPFLGALVYMLFRPVTEQDRQLAEQYQGMTNRMAGYSPADEIAKAHALVEKGAISAEEFEGIKRRALA